MCFPSQSVYNRAVLPARSRPRRKSDGNEAVRIRSGRALSPEDMLPVLEEARRHENVIALACGAESEWIERPERVTPEIERELSKYYPGRKLCDLARVPDRIMKLALLYTGDIERDVYPGFRKFDAGRLRVQVTSFHWIDAYARDASKGTGVEALQRELGIAPEETAVFGDYLNDIPMAAYAARSFAPANAHPEVLEAFTDVIGPNDGESVVRTIPELLEPRRPVPAGAARSRGVKRPGRHMTARPLFFRSRDLPGAYSPAAV